MKAALKPLSPRQEALIRLIQDLDPAHRHTVHIECRGPEPWTVSKVEEHVNLRIGAQD